MLKTILIVAAACAPQIAAASAPNHATTPPQWGASTPGWQQPQPWGQPTPVIHRHHHVRRNPAPPSPAPAKELLVLRADLAALRQELDEVRAKVNRPPRWSEAPPVPAWAEFATAAMEGTTPGQRKAVDAPASLPDLRQLGQEPAQPVPLPAAQDTQAVIDRARAYLAQTAVPGYTMLKQGVSIAIGRLHPAFAVRLAEAIRQARAAGLGRAGIFSAFRPPIFGVGGFGPSGSVGPKFNSLHSYGLAADVIGIGSPGSAAAHLWQKIVKATGLFLPYGADNHAEYNHTQGIPDKVAPAELHKTITASGPKDLNAMWRQENIKPQPMSQPVSSASLLPNVNWNH